MGIRSLSLAVAFGCVALGLTAAPAVAAPTWLAPVNLALPGQDSESPQVAVDPQGNATAVWSRYDGSHYVIRSSSRPAGGAWSAPVDLSEAAHSAYEPDVAVDAQGNATAVWYRNTGGADFVIESAARPPGGAWSPPQEISATGEGTSQPRVAVNPRGDATAVWRRKDGSGDFIVRSASRPAGGAWSAPVELSDAGQDAAFPQVAVDPQGNATAVWQRSNGTDYIVQSARRPPGGGWSVPVNLSFATQTAGGAQVAVDPQDNATAVWWRFNGSNYIVQSARRPSGGGWSTPVNLSAPGQDARGPQVAVDAQGEAIAVWARYNGATTVVQSSRRPLGGAWSAPLDLSPGAHETFEPQVAVNARGDAVAIWQRTEGSNYAIVGSGRLPGGAWSAPVDLSATDHEGVYPQLAIDPQGNAVAVWEFDDGVNTTVQAAGYDGAGPQLNALSIPAGGTVGQPLAFYVAPLDAWSGVATTSWSFGDGAVASRGNAVHTYATAGTFQVTVTATDALGNSTSAAATIAIANVRPRLEGLRVSNRRLAVGGKRRKAQKRHTRASTSRSSRRVKRSIVFRYRLSELAKVTFKVRRKQFGRKVAGKCKRTTKANRKGRRCVRRLRYVGLFKRSGRQGGNRNRFAGKVRNRKGKRIRLRPGAYRVTAVARDRQGAGSRPRSTGIRVVRR